MDMDPHAARTIRQDLIEIDREIEGLEQLLEAKRAVKAQLHAELSLAQTFPQGSGFTRAPGSGPQRRR